MVKKRELYKISERSFLSKFMKTAGIIAEYNPFHKGHEYQIRYTKEKLQADYVIVAMSGDYVQRGTPALISKHVRAEMALRCGACLLYTSLLLSSKAYSGGSFSTPFIV